MNTQEIALVLSALGIGAVLNSVVKAFTDRRKLGADTTSILTSAARELVEPLRQELQTERAERTVEHRQHIEELAYEKRAAENVRMELNTVRAELDRAHEDALLLRRELAAAHGELTRLRSRLGESDTTAGP